MYTDSDFDQLQSKANDVLIRLEQLDASEWAKKKDLIEEYILVNRNLLENGKLDIGSKKQFCSYIVAKLTERNITVNQNGNFYRMFNDDEKGNQNNIDQKSIKISSGSTVNQAYKEKPEAKNNIDDNYTKYLDQETKFLHSGIALNNALKEKYNESPELRKIMQENFKEDMIIDLINVGSTIELARQYIDDRNQLTDFQKLNLQLLLELGQTKAQAARDIGYSAKWVSIGIERDEELKELWNFLNECHICHNDIQDVKDKALEKYKQGKEIGFDVPIKGY